MIGHLSLGNYIDLKVDEQPHFRFDYKLYTNSTNLNNKPGGVMNGFEVPFPDTELEREVYKTFNTWLYDWQDFGGPQGPEPYTGEYMDGTKLSESMVEVGFNDVEQIEYSYFDSLFIGKK